MLKLFARPLNSESEGGNIIHAQKTIALNVSRELK